MGDNGEWSFSKKHIGEAVFRTREDAEARLVETEGLEMKPIYRPKGKAAEYGEYALNIYTVYMHIFPNGKRYIGLTKDIKRRFRGGRGYDGSRIMKAAIQKAGWNNVKHKVLAEKLTKQQAKNMEIEMIAKYRTTEHEFGYNITLGGEGGNGRIMTEEQKAIIGERFRRANKGRKVPEEQRQALSRKLKGRIPNISPEGRQRIIESNRTRVYSAETRKKMSENTKKAMAEKGISEHLKAKWNEDKERRKAMVRLTNYSRYGIIPKKYDLRDDVLRYDNIEDYQEFDYEKDLFGNYINQNLFKEDAK